MIRFSQASIRLVLEMAQALALLPIYAKIAVAIVLAAWVVLVANWNDIFPLKPKPPAIIVRAQRPTAEPARIDAPAQKFEERVAAALPKAELPGEFALSDPHVGPDGSIREGEDGPAFFLSEIKSFSSKDVCTRANGDRWACGLHAYATLRNSLVHKTLRCVNDGSSTEPRISCRLAGQNVALILIRNGLATLEERVDDPVLVRAQARAKAGRIGIWDR